MLCARAGVVQRAVSDPWLSIQAETRKQPTARINRTFTPPESLEDRGECRRSCGTGNVGSRPALGRERIIGSGRPGVLGTLRMGHLDHTYKKEDKREGVGKGGDTYTGGCTLFLRGDPGSI